LPQYTSHPTHVLYIIHLTVIMVCRLWRRFVRTCYHLLDPGHSLFPRFLELAIFPTRGASGKLLDLFLISNPNDVRDFLQIAVPWSDHDMIFLSCCFERSRVATLYKNIRSFRDIIEMGCLEPLLLWTRVQFCLWLE
jgi:hypothetical protein